MNEAIEYLKDYASAQNREQTRLQTDYYKYLEEEGDTGGESLEDHLNKYGKAFDESTAATDEMIQALEKKTDAKLPVDLIEFYKKIGGFTGGGRLHLDSVRYIIPDCQGILSLLESTEYDRLESLGLPDGIRHTWGNSRPELGRGNGGLPEDQFDEISKEYKWFGSMHDGSYESGLHFTFDQKSSYHLFYWHQDWPADLKPDITFQGPVAELLKTCIEGYLATREIDDDEAEDEEPSFDFELENLVTWLKNTLSKKSS